MLNRIFCRETEVRGLREKVIFDFAQFAFAVFFTGCLEVASADKGAYAAPGFDYAQPFELGIHLGDRVCIDSQVNRKLPYGGELIADRKLSGRD